eukprot:TRINITY_DN9355_c0_g1_i1.p1 TRINITY_DN9355_c0_g1~~TRINITY_DN9355_c0_g1_i1.p1  ORF type:complete len:482 (+),score=121.98 TRINITY_DN9355_c0_g1_i1:247-1692(+)
MSPVKMRVSSDVLKLVMEDPFGDGRKMPMVDLNVSIKIPAVQLIHALSEFQRQQEAQEALSVLTAPEDEPLLPGQAAPTATPVPNYAPPAAPEEFMHTTEEAAWSSQAAFAASHAVEEAPFETPLEMLPPVNDLVDTAALLWTQDRSWKFVTTEQTFSAIEDDMWPVRLKPLPRKIRNPTAEEGSTTTYESYESHVHMDLPSSQMMAAMPGIPPYVTGLAPSGFVPPVLAPTMAWSTPAKMKPPTMKMPPKKAPPLGGVTMKMAPPHVMPTQPPQLVTSTKASPVPFMPAPSKPPPPAPKAAPAAELPEAVPMPSKPPPPAPKAAPAAELPEAVPMPSKPPPPAPKAAPAAELPEAVPVPSKTPPPAPKTDPAAEPAPETVPVPTTPPPARKTPPASEAAAEAVAEASAEATSEAVPEAAKAADKKLPAGMPDAPSQPPPPPPPPTESPAEAEDMRGNGPPAQTPAEAEDTGGSGDNLDYQ